MFGFTAADGDSSLRDVSKQSLRLFPCHSICLLFVWFHGKSHSTMDGTDTAENDLWANSIFIPADLPKNLSLSEHEENNSLMNKEAERWKKQLKHFVKPAQVASQVQRLTVFSPRLCLFDETR